MAWRPPSRKYCIHSMILILPPASAPLGASPPARRAHAVRFTGSASRSLLGIAGSGHSGRAAGASCEPSPAVSQLLMQKQQAPPPPFSQHITAQRRYVWSAPTLCRGKAAATNRRSKRHGLAHVAC